MPVACSAVRRRAFDEALAEREAKPVPSACACIAPHRGNSEPELLVLAAMRRRCPKPQLDRRAICLAATVTCAFMRELTHWMQLIMICLTFARRREGYETCPPHLRATPLLWHFPTSVMRSVRIASRLRVSSSCARLRLGEVEDVVISEKQMLPRKDVFK